MTMPPNIPSFDMANKAPFLHPVCKAQSQPQPPPSSNSVPNINSLTSVLLLQTLANSGLLPHVLSTHAPSTPTSTTPVHSAVEKSSSPPLLSPSQLLQFLKYTEKDLGVSDATMYEQKLQVQHIGPDILGDIDDKILLGIGIPTGDIIHLKMGCTVWWNGPDAKRKCSNTDQSQSGQAIASSPPKKKISYKKKYYGGGSCHFKGPPMEPGNDDPQKDYDLWYYSTEHGVLLSVPKGYVVCEDAEDPVDSFFMQ